MFFIGIFGIESKEKDIGSLEFNCKSCNSQQAKIIKRYYFFHFFFIPLFKWKESYLAVCKQCNSLYQVPKDKGKTFEKGANDISYWDLKPLKIYTLPQNCPSCGKTIESNFDFCPYCGKAFEEEE